MIPMSPGAQAAAAPAPASFASFASFASGASPTRQLEASHRLQGTGDNGGTVELGVQARSLDGFC